MRALLLTSVLCLCACGAAPEGPELPSPPDARPQADAGFAPEARPPDAGPHDAGPHDTGPHDAGPPDAGPPDAGPRDAWPALQTSIPRYTLRLSEADFQALEATRQDPEKLHVPGTFVHEGRRYSAQLSYRGRSTKTDDRILKRSWQVRFPPEGRFEGVKRIELLAAWKDGGYLTEKLWYDLAAAAGLQVPRARYVHVDVVRVQPDGSERAAYEGVFTELESVTKDFLEAHALDDDGDIYRCGMHDCEMREPPKEHWMQPWEKRTNESEPWDRLWTFMARLNRTPPHALPQVLAQNLELDDYLTWMAIDEFIANATQQDARSFLVYSRETGRWSFVPWDLNNALSLFNRTNSVRQSTKVSRPLFSFSAYDLEAYENWRHRRDDLGVADITVAWSTLNTRILDDPGLRARARERLEQLLATRLREEELVPRILAMHALLAPYILPAEGRATPLDPYVDPAFAAESPHYLARYVRGRRDFLKKNLGAYERLGDGALVLDRVGREPDGRVYVQLYNRGTQPVSLAGLHLTGRTREPLQSPLPARTLAPGEVLTLREAAADPELRLTARVDPQRPELGLYPADGFGALDLMWPGALQPGEAYGRIPRGAETFGPVP